MTNTIVKAIAILAVTASASFAHLFPPRQDDLAVSIPFAFYMDGKTMQPGEYIVRADTKAGVLHVCEDGVYCASTEVASLEVDKADGELQLVFTRHDGVYYLSLVRCEQGECFELPLLHSVAADDQIENVQARKLRIRQFGGLAPSWS